MYTICFAAGVEPLAHALERALEATRRLMPTGDTAVELVRRDLPTLGGGWFYTRPRHESRTPLVSEFVSSTAAVLVWGGLFDPPPELARATGEPEAGAPQQSGRSNATAAYLWQIFQQGGLEAVQRLNGSFSAILADLAQGTVTILCDAMGRRPLRYAAAGGTLVAASHDVPLVASGCCAPRVDLVSAASIVAVDWSLAGPGLLASATVNQPREVLVWHKGALECRPATPLRMDDRLDVRDTAGRDAVIAEMIETLKTGMLAACGEAERIECDLTAGVDSRAIFGLAWELFGPERLVAVTAGSESSLDVVVAKRIAHRCGVRHERLGTPPPQPEAFDFNCRAMAWFENGMSNSKRAVAERFTYNPTAAPRLTGAGSELFRGYYYPRHAPRGTFDATAALTMLAATRAFRGIESLPWDDPQMAVVVSERFQRAGGELAQLSNYGWDVLDLFYLYERYARWGLGARDTWHVLAHSPFDSPRLVALAYRLPPPIGEHCLVQSRIIRTTIPFTYWWRFNRAESLAGDDHPWLGLVLRAIRNFRRVREVSAERLRRRLPRGWRIAQPDSHEALRSALFAGPLADQVRETLLARQSIARQLFGNDNLTRMIEDHTTGRADHLQVLGSLMTFEAWKDQIDAVGHLLD